MLAVPGELRSELLILELLPLFDGECLFIIEVALLALRMPLLRLLEVRLGRPIHGHRVIEEGAGDIVRLLLRSGLVPWRFLSMRLCDRADAALPLDVERILLLFALAVVV